MATTKYTTLNALIDAALVRMPDCREGSTFVLSAFDSSEVGYVRAYCRGKGWECGYFPVTEKFWDAIEEHKEVVHRFYVRRAGSGQEQSISH